MPDIVDYASAILSSSERRLQAAAQNLANLSTPGFKRQATFSTVLERCGQSGCRNNTRTLTDFAQGRLTMTGAPFDLAIDGPALFQLRDGETIAYSRGGSFARGEGGTLADAAGRVLQQAGGGDLILAGSRIEILEDGTVLADGLPVARIALFEAARPETLTPSGGASFAADESGLEEAQGSVVRQGFLESANVTASDEMVAIMAASREAESGGRIAQFYDRLMGQAIATFGGGAQ